MSNPFLDRVPESGLSPAEEAALRHFMRDPYDETALPKDSVARKRALMFAMLKTSTKCPEDPTGISLDPVVNKPTIVQDAIGNTETPRHERVCIQWFGETHGENLEPLQFRFELTAGPDRAQWMGRPDWYQVAFIGQIKNWPKPEAIAGLATSMGDGSRDAYVAWVWTDKIMLRKPYGEAPSSFASNLILLGNSFAGPICPQLYVNTETLNACIARLRAEGRIRT